LTDGSKILRLHPDDATYPGDQYCAKGHPLVVRWDEWDGKWVIERGCSTCEQEIATARFLSERAGNLARKYKLDEGKYATMRLDTYDPDKRFPSQERALKIAYRLWEKWQAGEWERGGLFWSPTTGVGKTHLVIGLAYNAVMAGRSIAVWNMPSYTKAIKNSYGNGGTEEIQRSAIEPDLLVMDDIGAEPVKSESWYQDLIYDIAESRNNANLTTLITSNLSPDDELPAWVGKRSWSRIFNMVKPCLVFIDGEDYRMRKRA
jgi:DNA replication protein DnaC